MEQRSCIKFCVKNAINGTQTFEMLKKAFGDETLSRATVFNWHRLFKENRELVEDDYRSGRPTTSNNDENVQKIKDAVLGNRHMTIRELSEHSGISQGSVKSILSNVLGLKRVAARLIPKCLNFLQKQIRVDVAKEMLEHVNNDDTFVKRIITGDETWVWQADVLTNQQSSE